jgi:HD domain
MAKGQRPLLPPDEVERLIQITKSETGTLKQRAQAILFWHDGQSAAETAKRTSLTENQVRYLWRIFKLKGLDLFLIDPEPAQVREMPAMASEPAAPAEVPGTVTLEALYSEHKIDLPHAQHIQEVALRLFDATTSQHRLPESARQVLEAAALLHDIAAGIDPANHHTKGRDMILAQPIRGFSEDEQRIIACATAFHRKKPKLEADPIYSALPADLQREALALSAILRVANGLDASQTKSTLITSLDVSTEELLVLVDGPHAADDASNAQKLADLWNKTFSVPIRFTVNRPSDVEVPERLLPTPSPTLPRQVTVVKAGRAFALRSLERVTVLLNFVQTGDLSMLPSLMREVSRLMDAATLADVPDFKRELGWLAEIVSNARLSASFIERMTAVSDDSDYLRKLATPLLTEQRVALVEILKQVDMRRYRTLEADLKTVLTEDVDPNEKARLAFNLGNLLWGQLTTLRTVMEFSTSVPEALDAVRHLQDQLIAFRELLGGEAAQVLDMLTPLESYLANIHTAQQMLAFVEPKPVKKGRKTITPDRDGAQQAFYNAQAELITMMAEGLPAAWSAVNGALFRRAFALAIAAS